MMEIFEGENHERWTHHHTYTYVFRCTFSEDENVMKFDVSIQKATRNYVMHVEWIKKRATAKSISTTSFKKVHTSLSQLIPSYQFYSFSLSYFFFSFNFLRMPLIIIARSWFSNNCVYKLIVFGMFYFMMAANRFINLNIIPPSSQSKPFLSHEIPSTNLKKRKNIRNVNRKWLKQKNKTYSKRTH